MDFLGLTSYIKHERPAGVPVPEVHHIPQHLMVIWTISVIAIVWFLRWAVLKITDVTDPKGPRAKVVKPGQKQGRWEGRTLERVWFWYFVAHIPITLCLDAQSIFPASLVPTPLKQFNDWYKLWSRDPIINGAGTGSREWAWLDVFLHAEVGVQMPCFVLGAYWLYKNDKRAYPLTLIYASHTATTLLPTLYYLLTASSPSSISPVTPPLDRFELASLLGSYIPFFLVPVGMIVDMSYKLGRVIRQAERAEVLERAEAREVQSIEGKKRR